jgi:RNase adaptor protein for sRNA GlmZ degradation
LTAWASRSQKIPFAELKKEFEPTDETDPLENIKSFDDYVNTSLQRNLEIEWRLSQLEPKLPSPGIILTIRELLADKTQLIRRIHHREKQAPLSESEREEYRNEMRRNRRQLLEYIRTQAKSFVDPEHILEQELLTIGSL